MRPRSGSRSLLGRAAVVLFGVVLFGLVLVVVPAACAPAVERSEVLRLVSPDGAVDAVVVQTSAGAGSPFGYLLTLPAHGCAAPEEPVLRVVGAARSVSASGVTLRWVGPRTVAVSWLDAHFRDPDQDVLSVPTAGGAVVVRSGGGVAEPGAPPGGMPPAGAGARDC